ncbi:MAG: hypothetical protein LBJ84_00340 [Oscillospiraceae bacterium]|jgi:hypothetical protein|nr:hypothetical protein [Oscillospiraceae bacterium]
MAYFALKKKRETPLWNDGGARELEAAAKRRLMSSLGVGGLANLDVSAHMLQQFRKESPMPHDSGAGAEEAKEGTEEEKAEAEADGAERTQQKGARLGEAPFAMKFSQTEFKRGDLTGAILRGEASGRLMLMSGLKRAIGQSEPLKYRQRELFRSGASSRRNIEGRDAGEVVFNRGEADSAVAIILNSLRTARKTVETLADYVRGEGGLPPDSGADALRRIYPFLDDEDDKNALESYGAMLSELGETPKDAEKRRVLQRATIKTQAAINSKAQMRYRFLRNLEEMSERAERAIAMFDSEDFREEAANGAAPVPEEGEEASVDGAGAAVDSDQRPEAPPPQMPVEDAQGLAAIVGNSAMSDIIGQ